MIWRNAGGGAMTEYYESRMSHLNFSVCGQ